MIFEVEAPCMSRETRKAVVEITDWFASPQGKYLKVFGSQMPPHLMLRYVTGKVVMKEVRYQLWTGQLLQKKKKEHWSLFPLQVGYYELKNLKVVETKVGELSGLKFGEMSFHIYDPSIKCKQHCAKLHFS